MSKAFLRKLMVLYGEPKTDDVPAFLAEFGNMLKGIDGKTLETAADLLIRQRKYRSWPTVAEVLDTVDEAKTYRKHAKTGLQPIKNFDQWWHDRIGGIEGAVNEREIAEQIDQIRPYAEAKWIAPHRLPYALNCAEERMEALGIRQSTDLSRRMTGDRE